MLLVELQQHCSSKSCRDTLPLHARLHMHALLPEPTIVHCMCSNMRTMFNTTHASTVPLDMHS